jgi:hypothetical protein
MTGRYCGGIDGSGIADMVGGLESRPAKFKRSSRCKTSAGARVPHTLEPNLIVLVTGSGASAGAIGSGEAGR